MADINDVTEFEEQLADAQAQIESLQAAAADAEARAATARSEAAELKERAAASETALGAAQMQIRESAALYRTARLASAPDVPPELIGDSETIAEVERDFEAATRLVEAMRERLREEALEERRNTRVPAGSPQRREPDTSALPASEKIRIGLQQLSEREGR